MNPKELIQKFNQLGIADMAEVTELHPLKGDFINLRYRLPSGQTIQLWDDDKIYYGAEICKKNSNRCYGLTAGDGYLLVCEYGNGGSDAEIVVLQRMETPAKTLS